MSQLFGNTYLFQVTWIWIFLSLYYLILKIILLENSSFFSSGADLNTNFQLIKKEKTSVQKKRLLSGKEKIENAIQEVCCLFWYYIIVHSYRILLYTHVGMHIYMFWYSWMVDVHEIYVWKNIDLFLIINNHTHRYIFMHIFWHRSRVDIHDIDKWSTINTFLDWYFHFPSEWYYLNIPPYDDI